VVSQQWLGPTRQRSTALRARRTFQGQHLDLELLALLALLVLLVLGAVLGGGGKGEGARGRERDVGRNLRCWRCTRTS